MKWPKHKGWRRCLIVCAVLLALFVLFTVEEHVRGRWMLARWEAEMRAKGEKFTVDELRPPFLAPRDNGGPTLVGAANHSPGAAAWSLFPQAAEIIAPGKARPVFKQSTWVPISSPGTNVTWAELSAKLVPGNDDLVLIRQTLAAKREFDFGLRYTGFEELLPYPAVLKGLAQQMRAITLDDLHYGRLTNAVDNLTAIQSLAAKSERDRNIICQFVAAAEAGMGYSGVWEALQADGWTDQQLARLQASLVSHNFGDHMADAIAMERVIGVGYFDGDGNKADVLAEELKSTGYQVGAFPSLQPMPRVKNALDVPDYISVWISNVPESLKQLGVRIYLAYWRVAWKDQAKLYHYQCYQAVMDQARSIQAHTSNLEADRHLAPLLPKPKPRGLYDRLRFFFTYAVFVENLTRRVTDSETGREMAMTAVALKRYQLKYHEYPANLSALVPEFLPSLPRDFFASGQSLPYRRNADGSFLLYSVGFNGKDDGGDASPSDPAKYNNPFDARDLVWPQVATPKEIEEFEKKQAR